MRPHGILFRDLHDGQQSPGPGSLSSSMFADLIEQIGPDRILPARQWMQCALTATLRPTDICLTFDGGLRCQYDVALPVLRFYGLTAFWFMAGGLRPESRSRQLWMGDAELTGLYTLGHVVGLHSHSIPTRRGTLSIEEQHSEYEEIVGYLNDLLGEAPQTMSHAHDWYSRDTLTMLRELGIVLGFRSTMQSPGKSELEYPREDPANLLCAMAA